MKVSTVLRSLLLLATGLVLLPLPAGALDMVTVNLPSGVSFFVVDIGRSTMGSPSSTTVSFLGAALGTSGLNISVRSDSSSFSGPAGGSIAASAVSWTTSGAVSGSGFPGMLSASAWGVVYESTPGAATGSVDVHWQLAPLSPPLHAGIFALSVRWKLEAISP